jgi:hypothetical protein
VAGDGRRKSVRNLAGDGVVAPDLDVARAERLLEVTSGEHQRTQGGDAGRDGPGSKSRPGRLHEKTS